MTKLYETVHISQSSGILHHGTNILMILKSAHYRYSTLTQIYKHFKQWIRTKDNNLKEVLFQIYICTSIT